MTSGHAGSESKEPAIRLPAASNLSQNVSWLGQNSHALRGNKDASNIFD